AATVGTPAGEPGPGPWRGPADPGGAGAGRLGEWPPGPPAAATGGAALGSPLRRSGAIAGQPAGCAVRRLPLHAGGLERGAGCAPGAGGAQPATASAQAGRT